MKTSVQQQPESEQAATLQHHAPTTQGTAAFTDNRQGTIQQQKLIQGITQSNRNQTTAQLLKRSPQAALEPPLQTKTQATGLPRPLQTGIEQLSGYSMNDVQVHYNSGKPAQLGAHAYAQGNAIYLAPGQQQHLPHEAWHVVQQKQGRVQPTLQLKGKVPVNDDTGLEKEADTMGTQAATIGSTGPIHTVAPVLQSILPGATAPVQGKFYFGKEILGDTDLSKYLPIHLEPHIAENQKEEIITSLQRNIWEKYGQSETEDMEMGTIIKIAKRLSPVRLEDIDRFMEELNRISPRDINTPRNFEDRIGRDTRIDKKMQADYIGAFENSYEDMVAYSTQKEQVKKARQEEVIKNTAEADKVLKLGEYYKNNQTEDFRTIVHRGEFSPDFKKITDKIPGFDNTINELENKILAMKEELAGAWYYSSKDEQLIFEANELQSFNLRRKHKTHLLKKSAFQDIKDHKTASYMFFFIEHKKSAYNTNSRFNAPATDGGKIIPGQLEHAKKYALGKRIRYPLGKLIQQGAIAIGGDLTLDKEEKKKMKLSQNQTPNKIFGSSSNINNLEGFLKNYCGFIKARLIELGKKSSSKAKIILEEINSREGQPLWDYLVREVAKPQLMVPMRVALSMKNQEIGYQPPIHNYKDATKPEKKATSFMPFNSKDIAPEKLAHMTLLRINNPDLYKKTILGTRLHLLKEEGKIQQAIDSGIFILYTKENDEPCWITYVKSNLRGEPGVWWECRTDKPAHFIGPKDRMQLKLEELVDKKQAFNLYLGKYNCENKRFKMPNWENDLTEQPN